MPGENPLGFLSALESARELPGVILITGPQAFMREWVLDAAVRRFLRDGLKRRTIHVANVADVALLSEEIRAPDLFAPRRLIVCRVMRTFRARADDDEAVEPGDGAYRPARDTSLAEAVALNRAPNHLVIVCESAPAKVWRAAEAAGVAVNCLRPFDNQLVRYAQAFARSLSMVLSAPAAEILVSECGGDLAAIANALGVIAIGREPGDRLGPGDLAGTGAAPVPALFEIAESVSAGRTVEALARLSRALATGRDPVEILAVEIVPAMRRMMLGAAMLAARRPAAEIAAALGLSPTSPLAARAIEGAKRFGAARLARAYVRAAELDARFKNGRIKNRGEALAGLILELAAER